MRFGAHYLNTYLPELDGPPAEMYRNLFAQFELLDELGYDDAWVTEHHFHDYGGMISNPPVFLSAAARTTQRIHLGVAISVLPLHHPLVVAEQYGMVDVISNGRLELGVGRGSTLKEFEAFQVDHQQTPAWMKEATELIAQAWSGEPITHHGQLWEYDGVRILPTPVQRPHPPIWVGASRSDDTFRWAGRKGYHLMTLPYMYEPDVLAHWIGIYKESLEEAGHDPSTREILGKFHVYVSDSVSAAKRESTPYLSNYRAVAEERNHGRPRTRLHDVDDFEQQVERGNLITGDARSCIDIINRWRERLGLTAISGTVHFGGMPQEMAIENIRRFAAEVIPAFDRHGPGADGVRNRGLGAEAVPSPSGRGLG
jgi:natural product biosynthesis luciferase-like monooxygenase protein